MTRANYVKFKAKLCFYELYFALKAIKLSLGVVDAYKIVSALNRSKLHIF